METAETPTEAQSHASVTAAWLARLSRSLRGGAVLWSVVLTVLVCAVAPEGLPHTSSQGSAFNPSTSSVALNARSPRPRLADERLLPPDKPGASRYLPDTAVVAVLPSLAFLASSAASGSPAPGGMRSVVGGLPHALPWARAPPPA